MIDEATPKGRIVAAALRVAAERPWADVSFFDIAEGAGLTLAELRTHVSSKADILAAFSRTIDDEVLAKAQKPDGVLAPRDRLFEVVMSRLDAMVPYRASLKSIAAAGLADPSLVRRLFDSQVWMLRAAGFATEGVAGAARVAGLTSVYASVFRMWLEDDDPGFARTMAVLDRRLRRGERLFDRVADAVSSIERATSWIKTRRAPKSPPASARPDAPPDAPTPVITPAE